MKEHYEFLPYNDPYKSKSLEFGPIPNRLLVSEINFGSVMETESGYIFSLNLQLRFDM